MMVLIYEINVFPLVINFAGSPQIHFSFQGELFSILRFIPLVLWIDL